MSPEVERMVNALRERVQADRQLAMFDLASIARSSIRISTQRAPYSRIEVGESRLGGFPDVPRDFDWPRWAPTKETKDRYGQPWQPGEPTPLGFIAQLDLSALPQIDSSLPSSGWLYFFYDRYCEPWGFDPADKGSCRVLYSNCDRSELVRVNAAIDLDPEHVANPCVIEVWAELTLPPELPDIRYGTPAYDAYQAVSEELIGSCGTTHHRLLGYPQLIQNPMELECQLASNGIYCGGASHFQEEEAKLLEVGAADWLLLLQIDTDEDGPGWMWGDVGRIYFWIKRQDLAMRRFSEAWLILQCS